MQADSGPLGTLAEEYHVASRNQSGFKCARNEHQMHYSATVRRLVEEAPLHLVGRPRVSLPTSRVKIDLTLDETIARRTSSRNFTFRALTIEQLATLLHLGNAVRSIRRDGEYVHYQRQAPNSGGMGSVEVFLIVLNVDGLDPGIYHFDSISHELVWLRDGNLSVWLAERVFYQMEFAGASVVLALTAAVARLSAKYGLRGYRLALLDVGHVSQNVNLASSAMGLQVCATAGFIDDELDGALGLDGLEMSTMLVLLIGPA